MNKHFHTDVRWALYRTGERVMGGVGFVALTLPTGEDYQFLIIEEGIKPEECRHYALVDGVEDLGVYESQRGMAIGSVETKMIPGASPDVTAVELHGMESAERELERVYEPGESDEGRLEDRLKSLRKRARVRCGDVI